MSIRSIIFMVYHDSECLTSIQDWMFINKLKLSPDKSEFMLIGKKVTLNKFY